MTDLLLEIFRTIMIALILVLLLKSGRNHIMTTIPGWRTIITGFCLVFFGSAIDITDNFPELNRFVLIGDTEGQAFLEKFVGDLGGFVLLGLGLAQWLPAITAGKQRESELYALKERYRMVNDMTTDLTSAATVNAYGEIHMEWIAGSLHTNGGYCDADIQTPEQWLRIMHPDDRPLLEAHLAAALTGKQVKTELRSVTRDGRILWIVMTTSALRDENSGRIIRLLTAACDITARKQAEEATRQSLEENKILLQELHHRVKNNLQVITGLIEMAKARINTPEIIAICQDIHAKIGSISLVHTQLSTGQRNGRVEFGLYAQTLASQIADMFDRRDVEVSFELDEVYLSLDRAVPCGLALNELLTNAFKHAVNSGQGRIDVAVYDQGDKICITVRDNGPGIPLREGKPDNNGMGLRLLENLVTLQLRGSIEFSRGPGTEATLLLPAA